MVKITAAERMRRWRASLSPEKLRALQDKDNDRIRQKYHADPVWARTRSYKQFHGITWDEFLTKIKTQNGKCAICGVLLDVGSKDRSLNKACMDHDHETGENRDVLCSSCNSALGFFRENLKILESAVSYIKKWRHQ